MSLEKKVNDGIKSAMLARDEARLRSLRAVKAAILLAKTSEGGAAELTEAVELQLLQKLVKQRRDSLEIFSRQQREDLAAKEREEIAVIEEFLPRQLDSDALRKVLEGIVAETGAVSPADLGKVMGVATKRLAGQADGKAISETVKAILAK